MSTDRLFRRWAKAREGVIFLGPVLLLFPAAAVLVALTGREGAASPSFGMIVMWGTIYTAVWVAVVVRCVRVGQELTMRGVSPALRRERLRSLERV